MKDKTYTGTSYSSRPFRFVHASQQCDAVRFLDSSIWPSFCVLGRTGRQTIIYIAKQIDLKRTN
jgi:hypothetical protein